MSDQSQKDEKEKKKKKTTIIIITVIIIILLLFIIGLLLFLLLRKGEQDNRGSVRTVLNEQEAGTVMDDMLDDVAKGMFECEMSMNWTFPDGKSKSSDAYVGNSTANRYPIYFDVILEDTGEIVYSSPVIPVGANVAEFALEKELPAGKYRAKVLYTLIEDEESQKEISQAGFIVNMEVLN
jgi:hypothetical protein